MKKKLSILLACLFLLGALGGCGVKGSTDAEVSIMLPQSPITVDPQLVSDTNSGFVASFFTAGLFGYDADRNLIPVMADSYETSEDGLTYTFKLKKDLKWSDGRPLTAEDFVFAFRRLADPDVGSNSAYLITDSCQIKNAEEVNRKEKPVNELGVSSPDDHTFVVELDMPCPYFCSLLTACSFSPCNEDFYHSVGDDYADSDKTVLSCGPYIMDRYEPLAMQIHFTKNPNFVYADQITVPGANVQVVANAQQALMSYESGGLDVTSISGELAELTVDDPELTQFPGASSFFLFLNLKNCKALGNKNIRMALSKSIDRESIVKNVTRAGTTPLSRMSPSGYYKMKDGTDFSADADRYQKQMGYDPAAAAELWKKGLEELGVTSVSLTLVFPSSQSSLMEAYANQMTGNLPGLAIELKAVTQKEVSETRASGDFDMLFYGWAADYADPTAFLALYISSATDVGYHNPDYDAMYDQIQGKDLVNDPEKRDELMQKAEDMLMDDAAFIPLFSRGEAYLIKKNVTGFQMTPTGIGCVLVGLRKEVD